MIRLYNTLTRKIENFKPIRKGRVGLYTCGPTVYNFAHIGNLRTYIFQDVLRKTLEYRGFNVRHIMNTTDIDDKTIKASKAAGMSLKDFTRQYETWFRDDIKKLSIKPPTKLARATEHIPEMIKLISQLIRNGTAYEKASSVYFDISKFKQYGRIAHLDQKGLKAGARVDADEYSKDEVQDFVLWKTKKEGEPSWQSPFGEGRPGWHIECSAISMKYLGESFDIHTGGIDLIFPHHENEAAQSEAVTKKKFVHYWIHGEHLLVDGKKMAKSLGNFYTLRDIEKKGFDPLSYRYLILTSHYRSRINFTWESLSGAEQSLDRLRGFIRTLLSAKRRQRKSGKQKILEKYKKEFENAVSDDLDTAGALAIFWSIMHAYNAAPDRFNPLAVLRIAYSFDTVLGIGLSDIKKIVLPASIKKLVAARELCRQEKKWKEADEIRLKIEKMGFRVRDTEKSPILEKI